MSCKITILSQQKTDSVDKVAIRIEYIPNDDANNHCIVENGHYENIVLGCYSTHERCKQIVLDIHMKQAAGFTHYEMPLE